MTIILMNARIHLVVVTLLGGQVHVFLWSIDDTNTLIEDVPLSIHYPKAENKVSANASVSSYLQGAPLWAHQEVGHAHLEVPYNWLLAR